MVFVAGSLQCFAKTNVGYGCEKAILILNYLTRRRSYAGQISACTEHSPPTLQPFQSKQQPEGRPNQAQVNLTKAAKACSNYFWPHAVAENDRLTSVANGCWRLAVAFR
jgi:hypothetical protein